MTKIIHFLYIKIKFRYTSYQDVQYVTGYTENVNLKTLEASGINKKKKEERIG